VAVGFGITSPKQAREIASIADGIVIGSAVVRLIDEKKNNPDLVKIVSAYVSGIRQAMR